MEISKATRPLEAPVALAPATPAVSAPACSLQRSGSLWQLAIEAQELTTTIAQLAQLLEADDDDTRSQALAELEATLLAEALNKTALAAKADATCWVIEHLRGQAAYRQQQAKRLTHLARSDTNRAAALEDSLVLVLTRLQPSATRFSFPNHELRSTRSQAVEIAGEAALAPEWLTVKTTTQPDKTAIKAAIKAGQQVHDAQLLTRHLSGPGATPGPPAWPAGWCLSPANQVAGRLPLPSGQARRRTPDTKGDPQG